MDSQKIKDLFDKTNGVDSKNILEAGFNLLTFTKSIPFNIIKAVIIAVLLYLVLNGLFFYLGVDWWVRIVGLVGGLIGGVFLVFTGSLKFIVSSFIDNVSDLLTGTLEPIEKVYDNYQETSDGNMNKKEFTMGVIQAVVVPNLLGAISVVPFKGSLEKNLNSFLGNMVSENAAQPKKTTVVKDDNNDSNFLTNMIGSIQKGTDKTKSGINKPFNLTLWVFGGISAVLMALSYLF